MDLLSRRTSTRRGTLVAGTSSRHATATSNTTQKQPLVNDFRAQEEDVAARVIQRSARTFLARRQVARLLMQVYSRQYDPIAKAYYYINTSTRETSWDKPLALQLFLPHNTDVPVTSTSTTTTTSGQPSLLLLTPGEAAGKIQRLARAHVARKFMHELVCENYMKLVDPNTKTFFYLNTHTGERSVDKPLFLRNFRNGGGNLPMETFLFRKAVCKVSSSCNLYGSGILGYFGSSSNTTNSGPRLLCLLGDAMTLPDADTTRAAHVLCNFAGDGVVPFQISLLPHKFFAVLHIENQAKFTLCAIDHEAFSELAGENIQPITLEMNDRKMGCVQVASLRIGQALDVVGHPHGKPRVVHTRTLQKLLPHSIAPVRIQYDSEMESGAAGSCVFTTNGRLVGIQQFTPWKEPPPRAFFCIQPILEAANALVTPPEPFLLTTSLAAQEIHVCWSIVRWFKPLPGLPINFELEICCHQPSSSTGKYAKFEVVYRGARTSKHVGGLASGTLYSVRVRAVNAVAKSKWSHVLKVITLQEPSLAWRIARYCTSVKDACKRMTQQARDQEAQYQAIQWMARYLDQQSEAQQLDQAEIEFLEAGAMLLLLEKLRVEAAENERVTLVTLRVLTALARIQRHTQRLLSHVHSMEILVQLLKHHVAPDTLVGSTKSVEVALSCVGFLGFVLDGTNASSAQQTAQTLNLVPLVLSVLAWQEQDSEALCHHAPFVSECAFLLARYTHNHTQSGKWQLVEDGRLQVLRDLLDHYETSNSSIAYWVLVTLGNLAYGCDASSRLELEQETNSLALIDSICRVRMLFLVQINSLELTMTTTQREFDKLAASALGDAMRNEMDACEMEITTLKHTIEELKNNGNIAIAGDFALRYLLTTDQLRIQQASQRLMKKFLMRKTAMAFAKWLESTVFDRNCGIMRSFLTNVRHRQLGGAFRKWEAFVRDYRKHHQSVIGQVLLGSGMAMDLNKKKKERYRMLVLQK